MNFRLWYPQLDAYDAVRRASVLLGRWRGEAPSVQRLHICDFFLANPPLLHHTHMPVEVRKRFTQLRVRRPEKSFLSYPSAPILFHKMEPVQKEALRTLVGKDLVDRNEFRRGRIRLSTRGSELASQLAELTVANEEKVLEFITVDFAQISADDPDGLVRRTGLRRIG